MDFGLKWIRRKQRSLTRGVLALFCLAWLQVAAVPCVMADGFQVDAAHQAQAGAAPHDCQYCPVLPGDHHGSGGGHDACAYPHEPQVDARATAALFLAVPVSVPLTTLATPPETTQALVPPLPTILPGTSLAVSYCRRIE